MSLTKTAERRLVVALTIVAAAGSMWLAAGHFDAALAQAANPFGGPKAPAAPAPSDGLIGWMFAKQAEFYRDMSRIIRSAKTDGSAVWTLLGVSFVYGIFHAAGPGHGKAVISSYLVANEETWRRGIVLSFASALLQAFVAVAIVGIAAVLLNATAGQMCSAERVIELASYALIALVGARLIWVKGKGFLSTARGLSRPLHAVGAAVTPPHDHKHHDHKHDDHKHDGHDHHHDHAHHDHAHDHHDADHKPAFFQRWFMSTNHKDIGILYLFTAGAGSASCTAATQASRPSGAPPVQAKATWLLIFFSSTTSTWCRAASSSTRLRALLTARAL